MASCVVFGVYVCAVNVWHLFKDASRNWFGLEIDVNKSQWCLTWWESHPLPSDFFLHPRLPPSNSIKISRIILLMRYSWCRRVKWREKWTEKWREKWREKLVRRTEEWIDFFQVKSTPTTTAQTVYQWIRLDGQVYIWRVLQNDWLMKTPSVSLSLSLSASQPVIPDGCVNIYLYTCVCRYVRVCLCVWVCVSVCECVAGGTSVCVSV